MSSPWVIVTERLLLAEIYAARIGDRTASDICQWNPLDDETPRPAFDQSATLLVDLEMVALHPHEATRWLGSHEGRRCGWYDKFTARIAEEAFDLGVATVFSTAAPLEEVVSVLFGPGGTSVTTTQGPTRRDMERLARLSDRELEVLQLVAQGHSAASIGSILGITTHTVSTHRRRAMKKLDTVQQSQAVALLARAGGVSRPPE